MALSVVTGRGPALCSAGKEAAPEVEMSIPGLDWGMEEVMSKDMKKVPQKKVPYAKPIPAQFQQVNTERGTTGQVNSPGYDLHKSLMEILQQLLNVKVIILMW